MVLVSSGVTNLSWSASRGAGVQSLAGELAIECVCLCKVTNSMNCLTVLAWAKVFLGFTFVFMFFQGLPSHCVCASTAPTTTKGENAVTVVQVRLGHCWSSLSSRSRTVCVLLSSLVTRVSTIPQVSTLRSIAQWVVPLEGVFPVKVGHTKVSLAFPLVNHAHPADRLTVLHTQTHTHTQDGPFQFFVFPFNNSNIAPSKCTFVILTYL